VQNATHIVVIQASRKGRRARDEVWPITSEIDEAIKRDLRSTFANITFVRTDPDPVYHSGDTRHPCFGTDSPDADDGVVITIANDSHAVIDAEASIGARTAVMGTFVNEDVHQSSEWANLSRH
jgi:hypothetical protein